MTEITIDIAKDFSPTPNGRYRRNGPFSGEAFREEILKPACDRYDQVRILLDTPDGFLYSFLDEAFGGLVRRFGPSIASKLVFVAIERAHLIQLIQDYIRTAAKMYRSNGAQKEAYLP